MVKDVEGRVEKDIWIRVFCSYGFWFLSKTRHCKERYMDSNEEWPHKIESWLVDTKLQKSFSQCEYVRVSLFPLFDADSIEFTMQEEIHFF